MCHPRNQNKIILKNNTTLTLYPPAMGTFGLTDVTTGVALFVLGLATGFGGLFGSSRGSQIEPVLDVRGNGLGGITFCCVLVSSRLILLFSATLLSWTISGLLSETGDLSFSRSLIMSLTGWKSFLVIVAVILGWKVFLGTGFVSMTLSVSCSSRSFERGPLCT